MRIGLGVLDNGPWVIDTSMTAGPLLVQGGGGGTGGASWWWWVTIGISAHCGREVSLVNYFILCVVRLGVTPVNYFGKINLADAPQSVH